MERASKLIRSLGMPGESISAEDLACRAWPHAVGRKIAPHTRAVRMVRTRLLVEVEDITWQRQLYALSGFILRNLEKNVGKGVVDEIDFRIVPRRREPQRAMQSAPALADDADRIDDPVLRDIYKASRRRAARA